MADRERVKDIKVGAFVLSALAVLVVGSLWVAGSRALGAPRVEYVVRITESGGLQAGDRVRVAGVSIGRIKEVALDPGSAWPVTFRVAARRTGGGDEVHLLRRTLTTAERWEEVPIDLAPVAGREVELVFSVESPEFNLWKAIQRRAFPGHHSNHHLGTMLGLLLGTALGFAVGLGDGAALGLELGLALGPDVGELLG